MNRGRRPDALGHLGCFGIVFSIFLLLGLGILSLVPERDSAAEKVKLLWEDAIGRKAKRRPATKPPLEKRRARAEFTPPSSVNMPRDSTTSEKAKVPVTGGGQLSQVPERRDAGHFIGRLRSGKHEVRLEAVTALGEIGDPKALDLLMMLLKGEGPRVGWDFEEARERSMYGVKLAGQIHAERADKEKSAAAEALGKIGAPAVPDLLQAYRDNAVERKYVFQALGGMGSGGVEPLLDFLEQPNNEIRLFAIGALARTGDPRAVEPIIALLKDRNTNIRYAAVATLGTLKDPRAIEPLEALLENGDPKLSSWVAQALKKF